MLYKKLIEEHLNDPRVVLSDGSRTFTFRQIHEIVLWYGSAFREQGARAGDRVLVSDNDPMKTVLVLLTCIAEGYICVPISRHMDEEERNAVIQSCRPVIIAEGIYPKDTDSLEPRTLRSEDTLVYLLYTSGSTGKPKGVAASQKQILFCCDGIERRLNIGCQDRILCTLPLSFDYGMYQVFLAFFNGAVLFLDASGILQRIPYLLKHWEITIFPTIPTVGNLLVRMRLLRAEELQCLHCITFTGEVLPVPLLKMLHRCLPLVRLVPMYGLTECKRVSVMPPGCEEKIWAGSCGLPLDGVMVWIEGANPETGIGELVVVGNNVMEGYWGTLDEESPPFFWDPASGKRGLWTGDLFRIDQDGFLYFCGRKSDLIKIRGYRVSGTWLENRFRSCAEIREAAVIGIPDELSGERAVIFLSMMPDTPHEPILELQKQLPPYLRNSQIIFTADPLPQNRNGKIDRQALRQMVGERL